MAGSVWAATITGVTPQGEVAQVRQIAVTFSEGVVPFGDPRLPDPMTLQCEGGSPEGASRWASDRRWLHDFREALSPGVRCSLSARAGWKPAKGMLTGKTEFSFSTGGPAVVQVQPWEGARIAEDQFFMLRLNGPAAFSTVLANAWCEVEGIGERISMRIVDGDLRTDLLKARRIDAERAAQTLVVGCARPLPSATPMRLIWGKGIAAEANPKLVTSIQQVFRYEVREAFNAEFSCERERADAPCVPVRPMSVHFSAPIAREAAEKVQLVPAGGGAPIAPTFDKDDRSTSVRQLQFAPPFAEDAKFTIELPVGLQDDAGRPLSNAATFPLAVATAAAPPIAKFGSAPFGIVERSDPVLPVTLRHVQGDLRPKASAGQVRVLQPKTDADILAWYSRIARWHESQMTAKELGLPPSDWF
ncbi:MAG: alpha-2-macroglobulin, partial [Burkholderiales bacterium]